ncbi:MAG: hypothetical protein LBC12_01640 [Nitrososphaerota archaeon]|nr:hypothetical protein [Nitrososphaerota archaeon]
MKKLKEIIWKEKRKTVGTIQLKFQNVNTQKHAIAYQRQPLSVHALIS